MSTFCLSAFAFALLCFVFLFYYCYFHSVCISMISNENTFIFFFIYSDCLPAWLGSHKKHTNEHVHKKTQTYIKITKMRLWLCNGKNKNKEMGAEHRTPEAVFLLFLFAEKHKKYCEHFVYSTKMIHLYQTHWKHKRPTHRMCAWYILYKCFTREHHRQ